MSLSPKLRKQAEDLVIMARAGAALLQAPMEKEFPFLMEVELPLWNFLLTVTSVFVAMTQLEHSELPSQQIDEIVDIVTDQLYTWDSDALRFDDLRGFYNRTCDSRSQDPKSLDSAFASADILGSWFVWTLLNRKGESKQESRLIRAVGTYAAHEFSNYWEP